MNKETYKIDGYVKESSRFEQIHLKLSVEAAGKLQDYLKNPTHNNVKIDIRSTEGKLIIPDANGEACNWNLNIQDMGTAATVDNMFFRKSNKCKVFGHITRKATVCGNEKSFNHSKQKIMERSAELKNSTHKTKNMSRPAKGTASLKRIKDTIQKESLDDPKLKTRSPPEIRKCIVHILAPSKITMPELRIKLNEVHGKQCSNSTVIHTIVNKVSRTDKRGCLVLLPEIICQEVDEDSWHFYTPDEVKRIKVLKQRVSSMIKSIEEDKQATVNNGNNLVELTPTPAPAPTFGKRAPFAPHTLVKKIEALDLIADGNSIERVSTILRLSESLVTDWSKNELYLRDLANRKNVKSRHDLIARRKTVQSEESLRFTETPAVEPPESGIHTKSPKSPVSQILPLKANTTATVNAVKRSASSVDRQNPIPLIDDLASHRLSSVLQQQVPEPELPFSTGVIDQFPMEVTVGGHFKECSVSNPADAGHYTPVSPVNNVTNKAPTPEENGRRRGRSTDREEPCKPTKIQKVFDPVEELEQGFGPIKTSEQYMHIRNVYKKHFTTYKRLYDDLNPKRKFFFDFENMSNENRTKESNLKRFDALFEDFEHGDLRAQSTHLCYLHTKLQQLKEIIKDFSSEFLHA